MQPVDIVGAGRVGTALHRRAFAVRRSGVLVTRHEGWSALAAHPGRPLLVATRNDDLDAVVQAVPDVRRADLVFVQNGMLRPWLAAHGLGEAGRGLIFFAVAAMGDDLVPGTSPSVFTGPHAATMVDWLRALRVPAAALDATAFAEVELEKLVWNSAFGLLCQATGATVGEVCAAHRDGLRAVVDELRAVGERALGLSLDGDALLARLCAYSTSIAGYRAEVKAWPWRNGWFVAEAERLGLPLDAHAAWAARAGVGA